MIFFCLDREMGSARSRPVQAVQAENTVLRGSIGMQNNPADQELRAIKRSPIFEGKPLDMPYVLPENLDGLRDPDWEVDKRPIRE